MSHFTIRHVTCWSVSTHTTYYLKVIVQYVIVDVTGQNMPLDNRSSYINGRKTYVNKYKTITLAPTCITVTKAVT